MRSLVFGALACAMLAACGGGDPSPGSQDLTFNVRTGPEPRLAQGESVSVALEVVDMDRADEDPTNNLDESQPFAAQVEVRAVSPLPPGISVDFSPQFVTPNQPGTINVRAARDAQLGRHELALETRIRDGSTWYFRTFQITVTGNCAPGTGPIARIIPSNFGRTIALAENGDAYLWGANRLFENPTPTVVRATDLDVPFTPKTLDFHTAQLVDVLPPSSSASSAGGASAFVRADNGALRLIARYYPSALGAPGGRAGWALLEVDGTAGFDQLVAGTGSEESTEHFAVHEDGTVWGVQTVTDGVANGVVATEREPIVLGAPIQVAGLIDVEQLAVGNDHLIVRRRDGAVLSSGVIVTGVGDAVDIAAGSAFSLAVRADGTVRAWGRNVEGQLGRGATSDTGAPAPVVTVDGAPLTNIVAVAAGATHALALGSDGSVWSWGGGSTGQLGTGRTVVRPYAERIPGLIATRISAAHDSSFAVLPSGRVSAWGENSRGQLGDGTDTSRDVPAPVLGLGTGLSLHCRDPDDPPPDPPPSGWQQLGPAVSDAGATPAIALDPEQRPVVAFTERDSSNTARLYVRRLVDGQWQNVGPVVNAAPALGASEPALVLDATGNPIVAWVQSAPDLSLLMVARFDGLHWQTLCGRNGFCDINYEVDARVRAPSLALDANGRPAAAWIEGDLVSAKRFDGTVWLPFDAGPRPINAAPVGLRTRIAFGRDGAAYLAWTARNEFGIDIVRVASTNGTLWVRLAEVPRPDAGSGIPDLGFGLPVNGGPVVAWAQTAMDGTRVYAAQWDEAVGEWTLLGAGSAISTTATFEGFAFAMSADSLPYVALSQTASDTGVGRMDMQRFIGTFWSPFGLFHGRLSALALALPSTGPIDSPHFAWVQDGAVEVWRFTP